MHPGRAITDVENNFILPSYNDIDLTASPSVGSIQLYTFIETLLDERYDLSGFVFPGGKGVELGLPARGRIFGVGVSGQS